MIIEMDVAGTIFELSLQTEIPCEIIKLIFVIFFEYYIFIKITNIRKITILNIFLNLVASFLIAILSISIENYAESNFIGLLVRLFLLVIINFYNFQRKHIYTILNTVISFAFSYILLGIAIVILFILNIFIIMSDYMNLLILILIYTILVLTVFKVKRVQNGLAFLQNEIKNNQIFNLLLLNIGALVLFSEVLLQEGDLKANLVPTIFVLTFVMTITVKEALEICYKQNLLVKELEETKKELKDKIIEIKELEKENLEYGKRVHTLAHKQKVLEYETEKIINNNKDNYNIYTNMDLENLNKIKNEEKLNVKLKVEKLSKQIYKIPENSEVPEIGIKEIDEVLKYEKSKCTMDNIDFDVQINGNIYYMVNNIISKRELQTLILDHVEDAIIAIDCSKNINRTILLRIGKTGNFYELCVYDSGIEFDHKILKDLGKRPITTHKDIGGSGLGFMNTFDTLKKYNASLIINEIGRESIDNFTKGIIIRFDGRSEFNLGNFI